MSSSNNSNLPIQPLPIPSYQNMATNSCPQSASTTVNPGAGKQQQQQQRNPRNFSDQSYRGRGGRSRRARGGSYTRPDNSNRSDDQLQANTGQDVSNETQVNSTVGGHQSARGRGQRSAAAGGSGGGRHRPRQQASRRIEDIEGLDIDLDIVEPIGGANDQQPSGRGRHTTYGRKVNLTHLLNYRIDRKHPGGRARNSPSFGESGNSGHRANYGHYRDSGTAHKFSKQQFLQANCQFVVLDGPDYTIHRADPDWPVDWDCIEEVKFRQIASTETTCPVCLEPPVAAKITRCGHIYCWTCMLQYLSLSDENCRQCPICFEPVYSNDLRSVVSECYANHAVDEEISMKLMIRRKGCVEVEPYWKQCLNEPLELSTSATIDEHYKSRANLVIVDASTVIERVASREKDELLFKLETDRNEPEVCFIEQAIGTLNKRIDRLHKMISSGPTEMRAKQSKSSSHIQASSEETSSKSYLFYQSADGQHIYLNPFSTKVLCHEYGSLEACPLELKAKVLQMDWVSMSDGWRKRFKYLEHLPLTCEFRLIEIDFDRSELVSPATYQLYRDQIISRARERERRAREERKREKIIQVEQNRRIYGIQPTLKINLNNIEQFPSVSDERYLGLTKQRNQGREDDSDDDSNGEIENDQTGDDNNHLDGAGPTEQTLGEEQQPTKEEEPVVDVALSFRDIQLQEAMKEAKLSGKSQPMSSFAGGWGAKKSGPSSTTTTPGSSSSFAKLLVDAKSSQTEWTKHVSNPSSTANNIGTSASSHRQKTQSFCSASDNDGADEGLRAPPCHFNIGDFIDMNVISGPGRRAKGKPKNSSSANKK